MHFFVVVVVDTRLECAISVDPADEVETAHDDGLRAFGDTDIIGEKLIERYRTGRLLYPVVALAEDAHILGKRCVAGVLFTEIRRLDSVAIECENAGAELEFIHKRVRELGYFGNIRDCRLYIAHKHLSERRLLEAFEDGSHRVVDTALGYLLAAAGL